ncbi:hypothetical protein ACEZDB_33280 [Streptacidiphilus sp. N1-3]|uniref:DUF4880 domain-containing protein n=1 Tax=Streptacidiphilus alkalitolerans TaxID=3342712 RepID=A0ABV6XBA5_9ACTN
MSVSGQPGLDEIEERFVAVLDGSLSRDEADRWAARWITDDDLVWDGLAWWALGRLHGVDLPAGPDGTFLHNEEQVRDWLEVLQRRRSG